MAPDETPGPPPAPHARGGIPGLPPPPPPPELGPARGRRRDGVLKGIALTFVLHLGALVVAGMLASIPGLNRIGGYVAFAILAGLGIIQWLYLLPVIRWANRRGKHDLAKGFWIGGAITLLLSAACWGVPLMMSRVAG